MLPLIPLALSVVPDLIRMIAGDQAGGVASRVADMVQSVTGTADAAEAQRKLADDPALAATLRQRLAEIALDQQRAIDLAAEQKRQAELAALQKALENTQGARATMRDLVQAGSPVAWGAPAVSVIVTLGFFGILLMLTARNARFEPDVASIVNITVGALAAAFATVVNFWLGSSQGSRSKDALAFDRERTRPADPAAPVPDPAPVAAPMPGDAAFERCLAVVLDKEGGFSDDPRDAGGPTNLGITLRTLAQWRGIGFDELSDEGRARLVGELRGLERREAAEIYRASHWLPMRCGDLPAGVALMLFDFGVNAGPRTAVKLLQRAAGVTDDGSIGPRSLAAILAQDPTVLIAAMVEARLAHYRALPGFETFGAGWTQRTQAVAALARAM